MPALNFKKQFAEAVESGKKRQTIRAYRADGRNPKHGQTLFLYTGMRTKGCRKLREDECKSVIPISIDTDVIAYDGVPVDWPLMEDVAKADGFESFYDLRDFFQQEHGLPFNGLLIHW